MRYESQSGHSLTSLLTDPRLEGSNNNPPMIATDAEPPENFNNDDGGDRQGCFWGLIIMVLFGILFWSVVFLVIWKFYHG